MEDHGKYVHTFKSYVTRSKFNSCISKWKKWWWCDIVELVICQSEVWKVLIGHNLLLGLRCFLAFCELCMINKYNTNWSLLKWLPKTNTYYSWFILMCRNHQYYLVHSLMIRLRDHRYVPIRGSYKCFWC